MPFEEYAAQQFVQKTWAFELHKWYDDMLDIYCSIYVSIRWWLRNGVTAEKMVRRSQWLGEDGGVWRVVASGCWVVWGNLRLRKGRCGGFDVARLWGRGSMVVWERGGVTRGEHGRGCGGVCVASGWPSRHCSRSSLVALRCGVKVHGEGLEVHPQSLGAQLLPQVHSLRFKWCAAFFTYHRV